MSEEKLNLSLPVSVYGNLTPYNNVISKARVRIFYKGANRNGTFITDEFAEKLLSTIEYSPICGIYDEDDADFTDHGKERSFAKAYGVVPENPNIAWENHLDADGVERTYACADVLLWTARYKEATKIPGSPQSMELYDKSIRGEWKILDGKKYFVFSEGCFIGLTPLGEDVEPCFEGAAFYTLATSLNELVNELKNYTKEEKEQTMINFKLSDRAKFDLLWQLLNPNCTEENGWEVDYVISDIYDDYALVYSYVEQGYFRAYYLKNDETDSLELTKIEKTFIVDITESELASLKTIQALNNNSFEKIDEVFAEKDATIAEKTAKIEELSQELEAKVTEINGKEADFVSLSNEKAELSAEIEELKAYKLSKEKAEKEALIEKYSEKLSEEVIQTYSETMSDYTLEELDAQLSAKVEEIGSQDFSAAAPSIVIKDYELDIDANLSPAAKLLKKHRDKKTNGGNE